MTPKQVERLEKTLGRVAREQGLDQERLRRWVSFLALCGVLESAVEKGVIDIYYLKRRSRYGTALRAGTLSSDSVQYLVTKYAAVARKNCSSLLQKRVSPHGLRHTAAMELLQAGVDRALIALWFGHESVETTQNYLDADLALKEKVLAKTTPIKSKRRFYRPDDELLGFLKSL